MTYKDIFAYLESLREFDHSSMRSFAELKNGGNNIIRESELFHSAGWHYHRRCVFMSFIKMCRLSIFVNFLWFQ